MTRPLIVRLYHYISEELPGDYSFLDDLKMTPAQLIGDNIFFYGEAQIVANFEVKEEQLDYPISFTREGRRDSDSRSCIMQWGLAQYQIPQNEANAHLKRVIAADDARLKKKGYGVSSFLATGVGVMLDITKPQLEEIIQTSSNDAFWNNGYHHSEDLRHPQHDEIRRSLLKGYGFAQDASYMDVLKERRVMPEKPAWLNRFLSSLGFTKN